MRIAIADGKSGTGKTTVATNLARSLARSDQRVLLVDADPAGELDTFLELSETGSVLDRGGELILRNGESERLTALTGVGRWLAQGKDSERMTRLFADYDCVLVDTSGRNASALHGGLGLAEQVLVPIADNADDVRALPEFLRVVAAVRQASPQVAIGGFLRVSGRGNGDRDAVAASFEIIRAQFPELVLETEIPWADTAAMARPSARYRVSFDNLAGELSERSGRRWTKPEAPVAAEGDTGSAEPRGWIRRLLGRG